MAVSSRSQFSTVQEMDRAIINAINARVTQNDILYIIGDFAISGDDDYVRHCFYELKGRKILIIGNHDVHGGGMLKPILASLAWDKAPVWSEVTRDAGQRLFLAHYAQRIFPGQFDGGWHFYGHSHGKIDHFERSGDVGVDANGSFFAPFTFNEAIECCSAETRKWS